MEVYLFLSRGLNYSIITVERQYCLSYLVIGFQVSWVWYYKYEGGMKTISFKLILLARDLFLELAQVHIICKKGTEMRLPSYISFLIIFYHTGIMKIMSSFPGLGNMTVNSAMTDRNYHYIYGRWWITLHTQRSLSDKSYSLSCLQTNHDRISFGYN